jgi:hypothetical protein
VPADTPEEDDAEPCVARIDDAREAYPLAAREYARAIMTGSPGLSAQIFEAIPSLFVDVTDTRLPTFTESFVKLTGNWPRSGGKIVFSRELLGRVRALARVVDTMDIMEEKARVLIELAEMEEARISAWTPAPGEPKSAAAAAPPKSLVRRMAIAALARSGLFLNDPAAHAFLLKNLARPRNDAEALLLTPLAALYLKYPLPSEPPSEEEERRRLLRSWLTELPRRLSLPADAISAEIVIGRLAILGDAGTRLGLRTALLPLLSDLVRKRGEVPVTAGDAEEARALHAVAVGALYDLDHAGIPRFSGRPYLGRTQARVPTAEALLKGELLAPVVSAAAPPRIADLSGEATALRGSHARCYVARGLATAAPDDQPRFAALVTPDRAQPHETICRTDAALSMTGIPLAQRSAALLALLDDERMRVVPHCENMVMIRERTKTEERQERLLPLVLEHPELLDASELLRARLLSLGSSRVVLDSWFVFGPLYERAFAISVVGAAQKTPDARAAEARLRAWIELLRAPFPVDKLPAFEGFFILVGRYASSFGAGPEAQSLFEAPLVPTAVPNADAIVGRAFAIGKALSQRPGDRQQQ